jgi:hypothetical protein
MVNGKRWSLGASGVSPQVFFKVMECEVKVTIAHQRPSKVCPGASPGVTLGGEPPQVTLKPRQAKVTHR